MMLRNEVPPQSTLAAIAIANLAFWFAAPCGADVITDWDAKASAVASPAALGERELAIVDLAMFDAVNAIARRYHPYLKGADTPVGASPEAAAASAAATALSKLHPQSAGDFNSQLDDYLKALPQSRQAVDMGRRSGEAAALRIVDARATDGSSDVDPYRPRTQPGVYVPTATMVAATWPKGLPFALARADQFRPVPPIALASKEWASDYNEVKVYGARNSAERTANQTETAKFWLMTGPQAYHPLARQVISAHHLDLPDSARFMAVFAAALTDAYIGAFDAKYHYEFWRPITAIRNGDIDGNPDTEIDPTWQPLDATPMHPEYPCAHCILSGAAAAVIETLGGIENMNGLSLTSPTAQGVTHSWSTLDAFTTEVANSRVWAGFHYRFSARVGTAMGRDIGRYVATRLAQPEGGSHRAAP